MYSLFYVNEGTESFKFTSTRTNKNFFIPILSNSNTSFIIHHAWNRNHHIINSIKEKNPNSVGFCDLNDTPVLSLVKHFLKQHIQFYIHFNYSPSNTYPEFTSLQKKYYVENATFTVEQSEKYLALLQEILLSEISIDFIEFCFTFNHKTSTLHICDDFTTFIHAELPKADELNLMFYIYHEVLNILFPDIQLKSSLETLHPPRVLIM